jgi:ABC-2 type transport system permease protein
MKMDKNMKIARSYARTIFLSMVFTIRQNMVDAFILFTLIVQPLLVAILGLWMLQGLGEGYAIFVVVGSGMSGLWGSLLFVSGNSITWERHFGTLETLSGVPTPMQVVVIGKVLANVTQSLLSMIVTYMLASMVLRFPLSISHPEFFIPSMVLTVFSFISFGLIISPLFILNPQIQMWQNGLEFPVFIISGFLFPVALLPIWTRPISWIFPTYWAAKALHASSSGTGEIAREVLVSWGALVVLSCFYLSISALFFRLIIRKAKEAGTLDMV